MTPRTYSLIAGIIFSLVALLHALRLLRGWLAIGDAVRLSITVPCPRCVMTTLSQGDLPIDNGILRTAAQHNRANVGVYASVLQGGKIGRGDSLSLE